jgi:F-type H+-transporting ATPase subunit epsilon
VSAELRLSILTPERRLVEDVRVESVTLPGSEGEIQVLPGHASIIGTLQTGVFSYQRLEGDLTQGAQKDSSNKDGKIPAGRSVLGVISSGFFEVKDDAISVIAETLELRSEIDLARAQLAQKSAEESLNSAALDEHHFKKYQLKLQRSLIRQSLASRSGDGV